MAPPGGRDGQVGGGDEGTVPAGQVRLAACRANDTPGFPRAAGPSLWPGGRAGGRAGRAPGMARRAAPPLALSSSSKADARHRQQSAPRPRAGCGSLRWPGLRFGQSPEWDPIPSRRPSHLARTSLGPAASFVSLLGASRQPRTRGSGCRREGSRGGICWLRKGQGRRRQERQQKPPPGSHGPHN